LSHVSATASFSKFSSKRSAILFNKRARSAAVVFPQATFAACAASNANSISSAEERAALVKTSPVTGDLFSKY